jgi:hypothetical protein
MATPGWRGSGLNMPERRAARTVRREFCASAELAALLTMVGKL